ncbi:hypothetical protein SmJEL517_g00782 [Synchytrium microbalum]|uniref:SHSP domain-containing protein n=1 Tax=Synchytrium microbalum TaxID=1806994 RepID=A0A507CHF3_9FUNG|nr:uncharacterized protein SmJEL517_g00782 [Synchytrium microbalum]TPX37003.1 hypothetical protein SmJEL517_g00782 [Synchytrium microbalum]
MSLISRLFPEVRSALSRSHRPTASHLGQMQSVFDDPFFRDPFALAPSFLTRDFPRQPAVDVRESDKEYEIVAEVPGLKKENLSLEVVNDNTLTIGGHYGTESTSSGPGVVEGSTDKAEATKKGTGGEVMSSDSSRDTIWSSERMQGSFRRMFSFPHHIDPSKVTANLKDGILQVKVPKEESKRAKIEVHE